jgi:hypothetical protein
VDGKPGRVYDGCLLHPDKLALNLEDVSYMSEDLELIQGVYKDLKDNIRDVMGYSEYLILLAKRIFTYRTSKGEIDRTHCKIRIKKQSSKSAVPILVWQLTCSYSTSS